MYYFETDEPDSCVGVIFVESSTITIPNIGNESTSFDHIEYSSSRNGDGVVFKDFNGEEFFPFVITTIGGMITCLSRQVLVTLAFSDGMVLMHFFNESREEVSTVRQQLARKR